MAERPIFLPDRDGLYPFVHEIIIEFEWFPGFSKRQAQKSIESLHQAAKNQGLSPLLEISTKSSKDLGVMLSAFNLLLTYKGQQMPVECAFQGSKVFELGGPYHDLYEATSRDAKRDTRLTTSGGLTSFEIFTDKFTTEPKTAFYDWLYLKALEQNCHLTTTLDQYQGFTDIVFNPTRSLNCQARAAALFISLSRRADYDQIIADAKYYLGVIMHPKIPTGDDLSPTQSPLPFMD